MEKVIRRVIAVDGMGGDNAPASVFKGLAELKDSGVHFLIFGDENVLSGFKGLLPDYVSYEIRHTSEVIGSDMAVTTALRAGKKSSMGLAIQAVKNGEAEAVVSSGNTGLYMALSKIILGTMDGISRPAIASILPTQRGRTVCLDLGANAECNTKNLVDFAILGEAVARSAFDKKKVKVALLNIGSEDAKGSRLVKKTAEMLKDSFPDYVGFIEGDDITKGTVDVIVTDGFSGNIALKTMEGTAKFIVGELKTALNSSYLSKLGALLCLPALNKLKKRLDPRLYNGAIIVGLNGVVVKSHGNSDEVGFANAVQFTINLLKNGMFERIKKQLNNPDLQAVLQREESNK